MNIRDIEIVIFEQEEHDGEWPEENAAKFIKWFSDKVNTIPIEYRDSAKIELDSMSSL